MKKHSTSGLLITFGGLDGSGKSTMIEMLANKLTEENLPFVITKQPTDFVRQTDIFRTFMDQPDCSNYDYRSLALLCAADRLQHINKEILPELEKGLIVISDRYYHCCYANLRARGLAKERWVYEIAKHVVKPDLSFTLDASPDIAIKRVRGREEEKDKYIDIPFQCRLRYEHINAAHAGGAHIISSEKAILQNFEYIWGKVNKKIKEKGNHEIN